MTTNPKASFYKLPSEVIDYTVDWADVLTTGDSIATSTWTMPVGVTNASSSNTSTTATIYVAGGSYGHNYDIINTITTTLGDTFTQDFILIILAEMDTSGVAHLNITRNDIIYTAMEDMGVYAPGAELPTAGEVSRASLRLNMMIKAWQAAGVGLWLNTLGSITLVANAQHYLLGPSIGMHRPLAIVEARSRSSSNVDTPLTAMSRDEYFSLPLKDSQGPPTQFYYDAQLPDGLFYVWPVSNDLTYSIQYTYRCPIQVFTSVDDVPDFPVEWFDALHYNLALRMSPAYKVPPPTVADIKELAAITLRDANDFDREQGTSVFIQVATGPGR